MRRILVTGGMGFIGSALVRRLLAAHADVEVLNLDLLTYAAHPANLAELAGEPRYRFVRGDVRDARLVRALVQGCWGVVHLAAETHVDRSLLDGSTFITANVLGTYVVLAAARDAGVQRVLVQSTDEVYGPTPEGVEVDEQAALAPRSPYSASKLGAEMQARAFYCSFGLPVVIARPMNTIGPRQHPEKAVPLFTINAILGEPIPLYGDGLQERDRLYVEDHAAALDVLLHHGQPGEVYNVGAGNYALNRWVAERICDLVGRPRDLIRPVADRPGHDRRYRLNTAKVRALGWAPTVGLDEALQRTVDWYRANRDWWEPLRAQMHRGYYQRQYGHRLAQTRAAGATMNT
jgi:dTDP-glucose 4,6-dehydratase